MARGSSRGRSRAPRAFAAIARLGAAAERSCLEKSRLGSDIHWAASRPSRATRVRHGPRRIPRIPPTSRSAGLTTTARRGHAPHVGPPLLGGPIAGAVLHVPASPLPSLIVTEASAISSPSTLTSASRVGARVGRASASPTRAITRPARLRMKRAGKLLYFTSVDRRAHRPRVLTGGRVWEPVRDPLAPPAPPLDLRFLSARLGLRGAAFAIAIS